MKVMAISDLHLGKDMSVFGPEWINHEQRIKHTWSQVVEFHCVSADFVQFTPVEILTF